ncbi:MAG: hypothetical protein IPM42_12620 [Saprospiraceae bacterium]|nr:hypothetical protein [Saprospiraceae bacterium]
MQKSNDTTSGQKLNFALPVLTFTVSIWLGCILVISREMLELSWFQTNILSASVLINAGISGWVSFSPKFQKSGSFFLALLLAAISGMTIFLPNYFLYLAGSLVLGFLVGIQLSGCFRSGNIESTSKSIVPVTFALAAGAWICVFKPESIVVTALIVLAMIIYFFLAIRSGKNIAMPDSVAERLSNEGKSPMLFLKIAAIVLIVVTEVVFGFWHLLLPVKEGNVFIPFVLPIFLTLLAIFRILARKISNFSLLWIYIFSVLSMFSLGMFYTLSPILFVIVFALSVAYLYPALVGTFDLYHFQYKIIRFSFLIAGFYMIISGFAADQHLIKITDLKLPENVFTLSLIQNVVKDLVVLPGFLVIISGVLFLKRRSLFNIQSQNK